MTYNCWYAIKANYTYTYTYTSVCRIITTTQYRRATQFFRKIYLSLYLKGFERVTKGFTVWVGGWTELQHIDPHSYGHNSVSFPFSWAAQPGAQPLWDMFLISASSLQLVWSRTALLGVLRAPSAGCWFSLLHLTPTDWTSCAPNYIIIWRPLFFLRASQIALIQPVHCQGFILIFLDRMHLLFTQVHFLLDRVNVLHNQTKS